MALRCASIDHFHLYRLRAVEVPLRGNISSFGLFDVKSTAFRKFCGEEDSGYGRSDEGFTRSSTRRRLCTSLNLTCSCCMLSVAMSCDVQLRSLKTLVSMYHPSRCMQTPTLLAPWDLHAAASNYLHGLVLADLDPATAKLAIGILGPFLSAFGFLFILRIVMSWYPKLPVGKFPFVIAYAPTEPLLSITRKLIPPLGGVDITPVVWFGLISFLNEILVGPQGLLVLLSQQV